MHIIKYKALKDAAKRHGDLGSVLDDWYLTAKSSCWSSLQDVRSIFPSADAVGNFTVFNIKGNSYRLIVGIDYQKQKIFIKYVLTHAEYTKGGWKNDPYF